MGLEDYFNWTPRSFLGPLAMKTKSNNRATSFGDPFGIFQSKSAAQEVHLPSQNLGFNDFMNDNADNWVKALTADDWLMKTQNPQDNSEAKKDSKSKSWWSKFWDRRPNSGKPADPENYGINPHGRFPEGPMSANTKTKTESTPILGNMKKLFGRLWKPNGSGEEEAKH